MKTAIEFDKLDLYTYSNAHLLKTTPKGIVLCFTGLGGNRMISEDPEEAQFYAEHGLLYLFPYINPWAWMNRDAVSLTDACVEAVFSHYSLSEDTPIISTGGSMGGLCSLVYAFYAARTPKAVAANCPVCDLPYHYTERPDLPRTLLSAFGSYDMPLEEAMKTASPIHLAEKMPDILYLIAHCEEDRAVNKQMHSDRLIEILAKNHSVRYIIVPGRGHCDLTPEAWEIYRGFVVSACLGEEQ